MREGIIMAAAVVSAGGCLSVGLGLATVSGDAEWVNRSGAAVVCAEGLVAIAERQMRTRLRRMEKSLSGNPFYEEELDKAERRMLILTLSLAIGGEITHGFGDLIFELCKNQLDPIIRNLVSYI